jgi:hypothetical protein
MTAVELYINDALTLGMEWSLSCEEILGGVGRATLTVQDRTNSWEPATHDDIKVIIAATGWVIFRGEVVSEPVELPVGMPWRRWGMECSDYNNQLPLRLVGAIDGTVWMDADGFGDYIAVDAWANSTGSDRQTIQTLFDHYIRIRGSSIETSEFVGEYLVDLATVYWMYSTLQSALEELASFVSQNLQFWLDPDLKFHWQTIPAWQDLAQDAAAVLADATQAPLARMVPELQTTQIVVAGQGVWMDGGPPGTISGRKLRFTYDGADQPEQAYIRGGTGFVYNNGVDPIAEIPIEPTPAYPGHYLLTFNAPTLVYSRHTTGYINLPGEEFGSPGMQVYVNPTLVPIDPVRLTGGGFWNMKTGAKVGWLVSRSTNRLGYGDITVVALDTTPHDPAAPPGPPVIGIGGSGWSQSVVQDPNKRQVYVEAPQSTTHAERDSIGDQVLYRGRYPTLRGTVTVSGVDGWRVGQLMQLVDARLPAALNGRYFVIQRVATRLLPGTDLREYDLDWGDGPVARSTQQAREKPGTPPPMTQIIVLPQDVTPKPETTQVVVGQLASMSGAPWAIPNKVVNWTLIALDSNNALVTGQGFLDPLTSTTDSAGKARTVLTTGARTDVTYFVFADSPVL